MQNDKKIHILYVTNTLMTGGAEVQLKNLLKYLNRDEFQPFLCVLGNTGALEKEIKDLNIPIFILKKSSFNFTILSDLIKIIKTNKIDIVHSSLFASNFWGRVAGFLGRVKIIASERSAYKKPFLIIFDKILAYFTDKIICNSKAVKNFQIQKEKITPQKLGVIYNGLDFEEFDKKLAKSWENKENYKKQLGIQENEFVIGNVCRIIPEKDLETWINVVKLLTDKDNGVKFLLTSNVNTKTSYEKKISNLIKKLGLENKIILTGQSEDITKELALMNLFFQSSTIEGFPNAIMEAMAANLPVAATPAGGTSELIKDNQNGIILPMNKIRANPPEISANQHLMANKILELINNPAKMQTLSKNARLTIENNFSAEKLARNTENIYKKLI